MARTQQTRKGKAKTAPKDEEEEEEEEEETKTTTKGKGKKGAKDTKDSAKKSEPKGKGKGKGKAKEESEEEEEEEEEEKKPSRAKRGAKAEEKPEKSKAETKSASKAKGKGKKAKDEDEEEEEKEEEKDDKKDDKNGKRNRGKDEDKDEEAEEAEADAKDNRIVRKKTKLDLNNIEVSVDEYFPKKDDVQVYIKGEEIYDAKLNQSNVTANNNKFYFVQVLQAKANKDNFYCYTRWGRVGVKGQDKSMGPVSEEKAIKEYETKLKEKTKKGEYRLLDMDYTKDTTQDTAQKMEDGLKTSKLKKPVADFVSLIFDLKMATKQMEESGYDASKLPLGKLSKHNIQKGYSILSELSEAIKEKKGDSELVRLSNSFYSFIPHNVGFSNMSSLKITDEETVKKKLDLLDSLSNIKTTYELIEQKDDSDNAIDASFQKLKCQIEPLESSSKEYKMIEKYIDNTKEGARVQIVNMFKIQREGEFDRYTKDLPNKTLLWHGSRLANYVGIISQGLRIAPPEAPVSGYRLGKGIYLADMFSKSHGYCASWGSSGTFCIMVCEGALGNPNELLHDNFNASNLPTGKHSTKALGHQAPPISSYEEVEPGIVIPTGKPERTTHQNSSFNHNEFIIYDIKQVRIRYLIWMKNG